MNRRRQTILVDYKREPSGVLVGSPNPGVDPEAGRPASELKTENDNRGI